MVLRTGMPMKMLEQENEEYINDCDDILDEMPIRIGYDINIDWIKNIEECRLKNEIDTRYNNVSIQEKAEQCWNC